MGDITGGMMIAREIIISALREWMAELGNAGAWPSPDRESENHCPDGGVGTAACGVLNIWVEYAGIALFFVAAATHSVVNVAALSAARADLLDLVIRFRRNFQQTI